MRNLVERSLRTTDPFVFPLPTSCIHLPIILSANVGSEVIITSEAWMHKNKHISFQRGHRVNGTDLTQQGFLVRRLCGRSERLQVCQFSIWTCRPGLRSYWWEWQVQESLHCAHVKRSRCQSLRQQWQLSVVFLFECFYRVSCVSGRGGFITSGWLFMWRSRNERCQVADCWPSYMTCFDQICAQQQAAWSFTSSPCCLTLSSKGSWHNNTLQSDHLRPQHIIWHQTRWRLTAVLASSVLTLQESHMDKDSHLTEQTMTSWNKAKTISKNLLWMKTKFSLLQNKSCLIVSYGADLLHRVKPPRDTLLYFTASLHKVCLLNRTEHHCWLLINNFDIIRAKSWPAGSALGNP